MGTKLRRRIGRPQCPRGEHPKTETARLALDRTRLHCHAAPGGLRGTGIDRRDIMAGGNDLEERRHREVRRTHEDEPQCHPKLLTRSLHSAPRKPPQATSWSGRTVSIAQARPVCPKL